MLTFPLQTVTSTQFSTFTDVDVIVSCRLEFLCTSFDHDASQDSFDGTALLFGFTHYDISSSGLPVATSHGPSINGSLGFLSATVEAGTWDTAASTGMARLTAGYTPVPISAAFGDSMSATFDLTLSLVGTTGVTGVIEGEFSLYGLSTIVTPATARPFSLLVGDDCAG